MLGDLTTLGVYGHTDPVPSEVQYLLYCILLQLEMNSSNPT